MYRHLNLINFLGVVLPDPYKRGGDRRGEEDQRVKRGEGMEEERRKDKGTGGESSLGLLQYYRPGAAPYPTDMIDIGIRQRN